MSRALCSLGCGPQEELLDLAAPTFEAYAERHGYDLVLQRAPLDPDRPAPWSKLPLLRRLLFDDGHDAVLWLDADAIVVDPGRDLADEVPADRVMALACPLAPGGHRVPNTGVWFLRRDPRVADLLERVGRRRDLDHHPWYEQAAVLEELGFGLPDLLGPRRPLWRALARLGVRPRPARPLRRPPLLALTHVLGAEWNSVWAEPSPHPRIRHFAGQPHEQRLAEMTAELAAFRSAHLA